MAVDQLSTLSNSLRTQFVEDYINSAGEMRLYDQVASPLDRVGSIVSGAPAMAQLQRGATVQVVFASRMKPKHTVNLSEVNDITPQTLRDATASVTVTMYGDAIQTSQKAMIQRYTDYGRQRVRAVGENMMETVEAVAIDQALNGSLVYRNSARTSLNAGTAGDNATEKIFSRIANSLAGFKVPGFVSGRNPQYAAITDGFVVEDVATSQNIVNVGQYQRSEIILNHEIGRLHQFRIVASPFAKTFYGVGAANASDADTTLGAAANALATQINVGSTANMVVGNWLNIISAKESGSTFYPTNERVRVASLDAAASITIVGAGPNGGLRYDHAAGDVVNSDDSGHTILFGGPYSLVKVFSPEVGEFGQLVPNTQGLVNQWDSLGWKWYGGYGRIAENWLYRAEVSVSEEA